MLELKQHAPLKRRAPLKRSRMRREPRQGDSLSRGLNAKRGLSGASGARNSALRAKPDPELAKWGRAVKKRDGNRCQWPGGCQTGDDRIDAHHKAARSQRPDLRLVVPNGVALCRTHHSWLDDHRAEGITLGLINEETYEAAQKR